MDLWVLLFEGKNPTSTARANSEGFTKVSSLLEDDSRNWRLDVLNNLFSIEVVALIIEVEVPFVDCENKIIWIGSSTGKFSFPSCYEFI